MNAGNWIELATIVVTVLGGGGVGVSKLTRIAVAVENGAKMVETIAGTVAKQGETVQDHEVRLAKGGL